MRRPLRLLLFALAFPACALAVVEAYFPLAPGEVGARFPLRHVLGWSIATEARRIVLGSAEVRFEPGLEDDLLVLRGTDRAQKPWSYASQLRAGPGGEVYAGDLDRDGTEDLVLVSFTGGNGLAPTADLATLMFDGSGRPVPFLADGTFDAGKDGVADLVDMDRDGKAELVTMCFDDGYWVTNVYRAERARWRRVQGRCGARSFPLFTRFTTRPNRKATTPAAGRHPVAPDLSNALARATGTLVGYRWADVLQSNDITLRVATDAGVTAFRPVSWFATFHVVLDSPAGRQIAALSAGERTVRALLDRIRDRGAAVSVFGQRKADGSDAELLWATER